MPPITFRTTTHQTIPASIGTPISSSPMEALIDQPGPIELKTVGSNWAANLSGLLNLKDPKAVQAGLTNHKEPIHIYATSYGIPPTASS
jgi:N-acyl homoserine lactone hydrolase